MRAFLIIVSLCFPLLACAQEAGENEPPEPGLNDETFAGLELRNLGPALMSGRISDIAVDPENRNIWYVAVGSGGVWKTVNRGTTWQPVFDGEGAYSIGCVTVDPNDPDTIWVGTGENVGGRHVGYGDGVYRSRDGGVSWQRLGLEASEHIGNILVDPRNSSTIYVAAQGPLWSAGGERGLYKSTDGGETWLKILGGGEYTGVNEVHMDPRNPDVLYAATHQRYRNVAALMNGGPESGIHKSEDGGKTWRELTRGLPEEDMGKIGLAVSPIDPDVIYATVELKRRTGGFYRSADGGETWERGADALYSGTGPHYYQEIFASPHVFDRVYQVNPTLYVTEDGGKTFRAMPQETKHSDNHALVFDPDNPSWLLAGTDGGLYESFDEGETWRYVANLPVTQFYKVAVDYDEPFYNVYGGTQDNNTQGGPSRTDSVHGIRNSDWFITLFGDGHQPAVDPTNPDIVYSEWQQGNLVRYDRKNGEIVYIQPQPAAGEDMDRFNWDAPILISPHDPARLYFASQRVWRSDNRGDAWRPVSGDLSRGIDRLTEPMMGRVWSWDSAWDLFAMSKYGTVTSLSESPLVEGLLYAGTDDGLIQVSEDGGQTWRRQDTLPGVEDFFFVNDIKADLHDPDTVFVVVDHHKEGDFAPYILKSTNRGRSWTHIGLGLPERHIVWRLVQDHVAPDLLFAGTEFGVFFTVDGGRRWVKLSGGVPNIPFRDLVIQTRENDLVGATFGRGFFVLDDYTPLRNLSEADLERPAVLFPVRDAPWYIPKRTLGSTTAGSRASQGDAYYVAPNPPFGAIFTYYLGEELLTREAARRKAEKEIEKAGGDTPFPGWDAVLAEAEEEAPAVVLTVTSGAGEVVRRVEGPATAGFHRVAWDLRYPLLEPWKAEEGEPVYIPNQGVLAPPGTYTVSLAVRRDGRLEELGQTASFEVEPIHEHTLEPAAPATVTAFNNRADELARAVTGAVAAVDEALVRLGAMKSALARSTAPAALHAEVRDLESRAQQLRRGLAGSEARNMMGDPGPVSVSARLAVLNYGKLFSTYGPTETHEMNLAIAESGFAEIRRELDELLEGQVRSLEQRLDEERVPWTPGRGVPVAD
jgi:photosystem II stability/assembly factor-like uncharacterized protein